MANKGHKEPFIESLNYSNVSQIRPCPKSYLAGTFVLSGEVVVLAVSLTIIVWRRWGYLAAVRPTLQGWAIKALDMGRWSLGGYLLD